MRVMAALVAAALAGGALGYTYDVVEPNKAPLVDTAPAGNPSGCANGCAAWANLAADGNPANQTEVDALWRNKTLQQLAGSACAQPGVSPFTDPKQTGGAAAHGKVLAARPVATFFARRLQHKRNFARRCHCQATRAPTASARTPG